MSTFAIGDLQGCFDELVDLLGLISFDKTRDRLILVGDLVNRGPRSLDVLRLVRDLGGAADAVLGNHDLHLLAVANGAKASRRDTLDEVLEASDCEDLLDWLAQRPLAIHEPLTNTLLIHAGLPPQWSVAQTLALASEASDVIADGSSRSRFLNAMYGDLPDQWQDKLKGDDRTRFVVNCLTRWRYCDGKGRALLKLKGRPEARPDLAIPWFLAPQRRSRGSRIVFGHWSTLGQIHWPAANVYGLDTGCIWGGPLTAMNLESNEIFQVPSRTPLVPED